MKQRLTEERRAALREDMRKRMANPEFMARLKAARDAKYAWPEEKYQRLKAMIDAGESLKQMIVTMSTNRKVLLEKVAERGWQVGEWKERIGQDRAAEYLRENWPKVLTEKQLLVGYREARGRDVTARWMRKHAARLKLGNRLSVVDRSALVSVGRANDLQRMADRRAAWAEQMRPLIEAGMSLAKAAKAVGIHRITVTKMVHEGLLPRIDKRDGARAHHEATRERWRTSAAEMQRLLNAGIRPEAARKQMGIGSKGWRYLRINNLVALPPANTIPRAKRQYKKRPEAPPPPPKPVYQTVEEFLASGGKITVLPAAAAAYTTATISQDDRDELKRYRELTGGYGAVVTWRQARNNLFKRAA